MTPEEFRAARLKLGLSQEQMGRVLGYQGSYIKVHIYRMETGERAITEAKARLIQAMLAGYRPDDWPEQGKASG